MMAVSKIVHTFNKTSIIMKYIYRSYQINLYVNAHIFVETMTKLKYLDTARSDKENKKVFNPCNILL